MYKKQTGFQAFKPFFRSSDMFIDVVLFPSYNYIYLFCRILWKKILNLSIATMTLNKDSSVGRCKLHVWISFAEARENKMKGFFCS